MASIQNELRAIRKLWTGVNINIVKVIALGEMSNSPFYFIDIELCDLTLEQYNKAIMAAALVQQEPPRVQEARIWDIMKQVTNGLVFIHSNDEVHRDLKPRNGSSPVTHDIANFSSSSIFPQ